MPFDKCLCVCVCVCVHNRRLCEEESRQLEKTGRMHCTSSLCLFRLQEQLAIVNEIQPWRRNLIDSPRELHRRGLPFPLMPSLVVVVHSKCVCSFSVTPFEVHSSGYVAETALDHHSATHLGGAGVGDQKMRRLGTNERC